MTPQRVLVVATAAAALVAGTAAPSSAGGSAKSTVYFSTWSFTGSVSTSHPLTHRGSGAELRDYAPTYDDRGAVNPGVDERVTLSTPTGAVLCPSTTYFGGGLALYGENPDWLHLGTGSTSGGSLRIGCTTADGAVHHFLWGRGGSTPTNCVVITRTRSDQYRLDADAACLAEDRVVSKSGNTLGSTTGSMPFSATITTDQPVAP